MTEQKNTAIKQWWPALAWAAAVLLLAILAPEERILAEGIRPVYVHVGMTWTGMLALALVALLGIVVLLGGSQRLADVQAAIYTVGLILFGLGFIVSLIASLVNWGGAPFREPRVLTALNVLVVGAVIWVLARWLQQPRLAGLLRSLPVMFLIYSVRSTSLVLHPDNPVQSAPASIKATFYGMLLLDVVFAVWASRALLGHAAQPK